ncbi:MAG: hypothetical protein KatS3mg111_2732 [Pirellulaceae bacterium]|nr:MAG: hypothetical protein KatS3mg111_2732 [Pirellulaceae bacterium]
MAIRLLIDGYNLLWAAGLSQRAQLPGGWARARHELLRRLQHRLLPAWHAETRVVFDTRFPQPTTDDDSLACWSVQVEFSHGYPHADQRIIELIREHPHAKNFLAVISSDHQIQKVAMTHRAIVLDAADFWDQLHDGSLVHLWASATFPAGAQGTGYDEPEATDAELADADVAYWLERFAPHSPARSQGHDPDAPS